METEGTRRGRSALASRWSGAALVRLVSKSSGGWRLGISSVSEFPVVSNPSKQAPPLHVCWYLGTRGYRGPGSIEEGDRSRQEERDLWRSGADEESASKEIEVQRSVCDSRSFHQATRWDLSSQIDHTYSSLGDLSETNVATRNQESQLRGEMETFDVNVQSVRGVVESLVLQESRILRMQGNEEWREALLAKSKMLERTCRGLVAAQMFTQTKVFWIHF